MSEKSTPPREDPRTQPHAVIHQGISEDQMRQSRRPRTSSQPTIRKVPPSTQPGRLVRTATGGVPKIGQGSIAARGQIRVALVDQETLFRTMVTEAVNRSGDLRVVASLDSCAKARVFLTPGKADLLVVDVEQRDGSGANLAVDLQRADPRMGVLIMTRHDVRALIEATRRHLRRPWSYASKLSPMGSGQLVATIRRAALEPLGVGDSHDRRGDIFGDLTGQQMAVLRLIADGYTNQKVAEHLGLSRRTVENHLLAIYRTLDIAEDEVNPRVAAVLLYLSHTLKL
ncbi:MAG: response regulator transcription factor [Micrococcales bacterium]|nr:response regulator transcription factor [Micrococcales bacterium]